MPKLTSDSLTFRRMPLPSHVRVKIALMSVASSSVGSGGAYLGIQGSGCRIGMQAHIRKIWTTSDEIERPCPAHLPVLHFQRVCLQTAASWGQLHAWCTHYYMLRTRAPTLASSAVVTDICARSIAGASMTWRARAASVGIHAAGQSDRATELG